jgi:hypothetical protein
MTLESVHLGNIPKLALVELPQKLSSSEIPIRGVLDALYGKRYWRTKKAIVEMSMQRDIIEQVKRSLKS